MSRRDASRFTWLVLFSSIPSFLAPSEPLAADAALPRSG